MTADRPPPDWYPDPSGSGQLRWWDGQRWTEAVHTAAAGADAGAGADAEARADTDTGAAGQAAGASAQTVRFATLQRRGNGRRRERGDAGRTSRLAGLGWPRQRVIAGAVIGGFLLITLGIVAALVVADGGAGDVPGIEDNRLAGDLEGAPEDADAGMASDEDGAATDTDGETATERDDDPAGDGEGDADGDGAGDGDADGAGAGDGDGELVEVDFDGVCNADVDLDDPALPDDPEALRPWHVHECEFAPVVLDDGPRWIVVIASLSADVGADQARAQAEGAGANVLYSSHYPSLNPDLWVVYDGPFAGEQDAADAAVRIGGGSYPRVLSDDGGDRYCVIADGCVGADPS